MRSAIWLATLSTGVLIAGAATAREQGDSAAPVPPPAVHRLQVDAKQLRPGQFVYETTLERDVSTTLLGTMTITVAVATYVGAPAWLLTERREVSGLPAIDSVYVDFATLRPLHWGSAQDQARLAIEFHGDSAFGATSAPTNRRSIIAPTPGFTFVNSAHLETTLRLLPLQVAWEDSASTLAVTLNSFSTYPTRLAVIGEDRVRVPAGTFDCWVVAVHAGDTGRGLYWVTKRDPIVVRSTRDVPAMGGAQVVTALSRIAR